MPESLRALADHGLVAGLDRAGPDEVARVAKRLVSHSARVGLKIAQCCVEIAGLGGGHVECSSCGEDRRDVARIELVFTVDEPGGPVLAEHGGEQLCEAAEVLSRVKEIDDVGRSGEVFLLEVPDPHRASPSATSSLALAEPRRRASASMRVAKCSTGSKVAT